MADSRYYQPKDTKDAMRYVEGLFNKYKDAPLTDALIEYNQKLSFYLRNDVVRQAEAEHHPDRKQKALEMADLMDQWLRTRALGKPFKGKMKGFKMKNSHSTRYHVDQGRRKNRQTVMRKTMRK